MFRESQPAGFSPGAAAERRDALVAGRNGAICWSENQMKAILPRDAKPVGKYCDQFNNWATTTVRAGDDR